MPRGVQKSIEDRVKDVDAQITEMEARKEKIQEKINELKQKRESIFDEQKQKQLEELNNLITQSGKTPAELLELLKAGDSD